MLLTLTRHTALASLTAVGLAIGAAPAFALPEVGAKAPAFSVVDSAGKTRSLNEFAGKTVVLEWTNHDCPFVKKHYDSGNMQKTQATAAADGAVWLSVVSSAPGKQGHVSPAEAGALTASRKAQPAAVLLDADGAMGKAYGAKTTPHMFVIDKAGTLVYAGGIDDKPTANQADIAGATNYVLAALGSVKSGTPVAVPTSKPYGCSVKY